MPHSQYLICYDLNEALENQVFEHPSDNLHKLGISFESFAYDTLLDQCIFKGCRNLPEVMPTYFAMVKYGES